MYFKHGYGSLDLYVLSPFENSADYKEFLNQTQNKVNSNSQKASLNVHQTLKSVSHLSSAVVALVWKPVKVGENAVRILYTGNAPQHIVLNALDRIKDFDLLQTPVFKIKAETPADAATNKTKKQQKPKIADNGDKPIAVVQNGGEKKTFDKKPQQAENQQAGGSKQPSLNGATNGQPKQLNKLPYLSKKLPI